VPLAPKVLSAAVLAALLLAAPVQGKSKGDPLWATVNVCNSEKDVIGIRASMPGRGKKGEMLMRFRVQYWDGDKWRMLKGDGADSGFFSVGPSDKVRQAGTTFSIDPEENGTLLRGYVQFEWREDGKVVRRKKEVTEFGHQSVKGADPPGFTAKTCVIY